MSIKKIFINGLFLLTSFANYSYAMEQKDDAYFKKDLDKKYNAKLDEIRKIWQEKLEPHEKNLGGQAGIRNFCRWYAIAETEIPEGVGIEPTHIQIFITNKNVPKSTNFVPKPKNPLLAGNAGRNWVYDLEDYKNKLADKAFDECKRILPFIVKNYKIHLMPKESSDNDTQEVEMVWIKLLQLVKKDKALQQLISFIKILPLSFTRISNTSPRAPRIVIYINGDTKIANEALKKIYNEFKDIEGSDVQPGYNERVTSLIFFTNGDRNCKSDEYKKYYEDNRIYFKSDITGKQENYHLDNPAKQKQASSSSSSSSNSLTQKQ